MEFLKNFKETLKNEKGFTLLELIAVIAILGIIAAISFTAFSTQGEKARVSAHETNINTIEQAASRYETEKGFDDTTDFKVITEDHPLVVGGYLKDVPKNPWESTNKEQKNYVYVITKDKRGMFFAYLTESSATPVKVVTTKNEEANVENTGTSPRPTFVPSLDPSTAGKDDRLLK